MCERYNILATIRPDGRKYRQLYGVPNKKQKPNIPIKHVFLWASFKLPSSAFILGIVHACTEELVYSKLFFLALLLLSVQLN